MTDAYASINDPPGKIACEHCRGRDSHRAIARVAYHASQNTKTAKLDPKYEKLVDASMRNRRIADPDRLLRNMKPFGRTHA